MDGKISIYYPKTLDKVITTVTSISFLLTFIYLYTAIIQKYISKNLLKRDSKLNIYWIHYLLSFTLLIFFTLVYFIYLLKIILTFSLDEWRNKPLIENSYGLICYFTFISLIYLLFINYIFDFIKLNKFILSIKKIEKLSYDDLFTINQKIRNLQIYNIFKKPKNIYYLSLTYIVFIISIFIYRFSYYNKFDKGKMTSVFYSKLLYYFLSTLLYITVMIIIIDLFFLSHLKNNLIKRKYNCYNLNILKIYHMNIQKIIFLSDYLVYKISLDFIGNIPLFLFLSFKRMHTWPYVISNICFFFHYFMLGSLYLYIDTTLNKSNFIDNSIKYIFAFNSINFHFNTKLRIKSFYESDFEYLEQENDIFQELNRGNKNNLLTKDDNVSLFNDESELDNSIYKEESNENGDDKRQRFLFNQNNKLNNEIYKYKNPLNLNNMQNNNVNDDDEFDENCVNRIISQNKNSNLNIMKEDEINFNKSIDYFILFKLLYEYFNNNSKAYYDSINRVQEDESFKLLNYNNLGNNTSTYTLMSNYAPSNRESLRQSLKDQNIDFEQSLNQINRMSIRNQKETKAFFKFKFNDFFTNLQEKLLKKKFINSYSHKSNYKSHGKNIEFKIESLFNEYLFNLFPFYQITINDILESLDPTNEENLKNYKNFANKILYDNSLLSMGTGFYTFNGLLFIEPVSDDRLKYNEMKNYIIKYQEYLMKILNELDFTFLPLIVGVYNIEFLGMKRVVFLYRHPLALCSKNKYSKWMNFIVSERTNKNKNNGICWMGQGMLDINDIEVKDNIYLNDVEFNQVQIIIDRDLNFIKNSFNFNTFPVLNFFVGIYNLSKEPSREDLTSELNNEGSLKSYNTKLKDSNYNLISNSIVDNSDIDIESSSIQNRNSNNSNQLISLFENMYHKRKKETGFCIKIYFNNLFRNTCEINQMFNEKEYQINTEAYCGFIKQQLLSHLHKSNELFGFENDVSECSGLSN